MNDSVKWKLVAAGSAMLAGAIIKKALETGWEAALQHEPPEQDDATSDNWKELIAWTAITGLAVGLGQILARRGAYYGWKKITGRKPPVN